MVVPLQIPPRRLLPLDRLEQRLEVALAEALGALPLDDLVEQRRAGPRTGLVKICSR